MSLTNLNNLEALKLFPLHYDWAYSHVQQAKSNTWFPEEIPLGDDLADWNTRLNPEEKRAVEFLLGYFNPMESVVTNNIALGLYPLFTAPEVRLYLARQMWEEANHTMSFEYYLKTIPVNRARVFGAHKDVPEIAAKEAFQVSLTRELLSGVDLQTLAGKQKLLRDLVGYFVIMEGVFFYGGFLTALSFRRRNLLRGLGTLIDWVVKDESLHLSFGIYLINTFTEENPEVMTAAFAYELHAMILNAVELERAYNRALLPKPLMGLSADTLNQYVEYLTDRRLEELGFEAHYGATNPAKWMAAQIDVPEMVNFFEARNTSYEVGASRE